MHPDSPLRIYPYIHTPMHPDLSPDSVHLNLRFVPDGMFDLVDTWVDSVEQSEYIAFIQSTLQDIAR